MKMNDVKSSRCSQRRSPWGCRAGLLLALVLGAALPDSVHAAFKADLEARSAGSTNWISGPLLGWQELDYIPFRVVFTGGPASNVVVTVNFDHTKGSVPGMEDLSGFTASSNVVVTAAPTLSAPAGVDIWSYSFTVNVTNAQLGSVEFLGRLAAGSHNFPGASLNVSLPAVGQVQISKPGAQLGSPDLAIAKAGPAQAKTNQIITYALFYTNKWTSPDTATGVQVSDTLPPQVSYLPGSASRGAKIVGNTIIWDLGNVKPGASGLLTYKAVVTNNLAVTTTFANSARILSSEDDATPADNYASVTTTVVIIPTPLAEDDYYRIAKNETLTVPAPGVLLNDSNALYGTLFSGPVDGTVVFNTNGSFFYTPATNFVGTDYFVYFAANATNLSGPGVVTIDVTNAAPVAAGQAVTVPEDTATNLVLTATDAEGDPLTFAIVTGPTNGTITGFDANTGALIYTPNADFNGADSFTFQASDGWTNSGIATVNLTIMPVNDTPVATGQTVTILEDTATNLVFTASDPEGDPLTYMIVNGPSHGSLSSFNPYGGTVTYTPSPDYNGSDSFTFLASDGVSNSAPAVVNINVLPVNDNPVAVADVGSTTKNTPIPLFVLDNDYDVDGDALTITTASATNGTVTIVGQTNLYFVPASNFVGYASVSYSITDGNGGFASAPGSVLIAVGTNAPPVAVNDSLSTPEDTAVTIDPLANDYDLDDEPLTIIAALPTNGTATILGGTNLLFVPDTNFVGLATIGYSISDTNGATGSALIQVTVTPVNDPPVLVNDTLTTTEDSTNSIPVLANDSDVDGDALTLVSVTPPANGTASVVGTNVVYTPAQDFNGTNVFTYFATDGTVTNSALVTVIVNPVNDAPVVMDQSVTIPEDTSTNLVLTATDVDSTNLTYAILDGPTNGSLSVLDVNSGAVTYTPNTNYNGLDGFAFTVFDGVLYSTGTVSITVTPVNDAPALGLAIPDQTGVYGSPFSYTFSTNTFTDEDAGQTLTITASNLPPGITFNAPASFSGTPTLAGVFPVTVVATDNGSPSLSVSDTFNITIAPAALTVTADSLTRAYAQMNPPFTYTVTGFVLGDTTNVISGAPVLSTSATTNSPVGVYPITVGLGTLAASNYTFTAVDGTLTVTSATTVVTWNPVSPITYGTPLGTNQLNATASVDGTFSYNPTNGAVLPAGTNTLSLTFTPTDTNYTAVNLSASLVVLPAELTVAADNLSRPYGQPNPPLTYTITGFVLGETANVVSGAPVLSTSATTNSPVGVYPITVGLGTLAASNYTFTAIDGTLTVASATIVVTWNPAGPTTYGTPLSTNQLNATASVDGTFSYSPTNGAVLPAGTNTLSLAFTPTDTNYTAVNLTAPLVVLPAELTIAAGNHTRAYGQPNPLLTYLISGFVLGETTNVVSSTPVLNTTATTSSPVGTYPITVDLSALVASNYTFIAINGTLTVTSATIVVTWDPAGPITYGTPLGTNQLNATASVDGTFSYSPTNGAVLPAGTNTLSLAFTPTDTNFTAANLTTSLVVLPAELTVAADNLSRPYGQFNPLLTYTISGFVAGDATNVVSGAPVLDTTATKNSPVGAYPITVDLGTLAASNYTFMAVNGILTVQPVFALSEATKVFNPQTGLYEQLVTVTNITSTTMPAMRLLVGDFASTNGTPRTNVWLWNAVGTNFDGRTYVQYNSPLDPGQFVSLLLEFYNPTRQPFTNSLEAVAVLPTPAVTNLTGGVDIDTAFVDGRDSGNPRFVIEWISQVGASYTVIYSDDYMVTWTAATPSVTATATRTQWYDDGPPKTASKPLSSGSRFYRVILNNP